MINETEINVIRMISENCKITKPEIAEMIKASPSTVDRTLASLKKKGVLKRVGSNKAGYWKVDYSLKK